MLSSAPTESANREKDPDNIYLWRMNPRRMEAEAVRDSLLYLSGQLESDMGGEEIAADKGQELFRAQPLLPAHTRHADDFPAFVGRGQPE